MIHNTECDFYNFFKEIDNFNLPKVFYVQKLLPKENQIGVIMMEDLSETTQALGMFCPLQEEQVCGFHRSFGIG